jgi:hypothetical protein
VTELSREKQSTKLELDRIIFIGRTFEEYMRMFSLSVEELRGNRILDCPGGACSFTAIGNNMGLDITACDIAYDHEVEQLREKGIRDVEHAILHMEKVKDSYVWDYFHDIEGLQKNRIQALNDCTRHMMTANEKYIPAVLPSLPFKNEEFDLLLSAHFLFTYADRLDFEFHIKVMEELLRVTKKEVRIFPLVDLEGKRYEHLDKVIRYLAEIGYAAEEVKVSYEFQANANSMLLITKNKEGFS